MILITSKFLYPIWLDIYILQIRRIYLENLSYKKLNIKKESSWYFSGQSVERDVKQLKPIYKNPYTLAVALTTYCHLNRR